MRVEEGHPRTIHELVERGSVRPVYQPLVELSSGRVVGFEALARGPQGSDFERPDQLFGAAREAGVVGELDWVCKTAAVRGAVETKLRPPLALFINSEPDVAGALMSPEFAESWAAAKLSFLRLVFEITERAITTAPADLLRSIDYLRSLGWGVALDDVGADPQSLALLPYIRPDVIKLDMRVVQKPLDRELGELILAVNAEVERSGALVLAEGIETEEHLRVAKMVGAQLGQGWLFGRPGPLPDVAPEPGVEVRVSPRRPAADVLASPFDILKDRARTRIVGERELVGVSRLLEARAEAIPYSPVVLADFQSAARLSNKTKVIYERLAKRSPFVVALGLEMEDEPVPGVRGVALRPEDPMTREWTVSIVSPYTAVMLCAREIDPDQLGRRFEVVLTFQRESVIEASTAMLTRIMLPQGKELANAGRVEFATAMAEALASSEDAKATARPLLEAMAEVTGLESTFLSKITDDDYEVLVSENRGDLDVQEGATVPWTEAICKTALAEGRQSYADVQVEMQGVPAAASEMGFRTFVTCPVVIGDGKIVGTLCGASALPGGISEDALNVVRSFARLIGERLMRDAST